MSSTRDAVDIVWPVLPSGQKIAISAFTNSAAYEQKVAIRSGDATLAEWIGTGVQVNQAVGSVQVDTAGVSGQSISMGLQYRSPGSGWHESGAIVIPFKSNSLNGYIVGGKDDGPIYHNVVALVYWTERQSPGKPDPLVSNPVKIDVPASTSVLVNGFSNSGAYAQRIVVKEEGAMDLVWTGTGPQVSKLIGQVSLKPKSGPSKVGIGMTFDPGNGFKPSRIVAIPFSSETLAGYVVGGSDGGSAYHNTVAMVYWSTSY